MSRGGEGGGSSIRLQGIFPPGGIVLVRWQIRICEIYGALPAVCSARRVGIDEVLGFWLEYGIERPVYLTLITFIPCKMSM